MIQRILARVGSISDRSCRCDSQHPPEVTRSEVCRSLTVKRSDWWRRNQIPSLILCGNIMSLRSSITPSVDPSPTPCFCLEQLRCPLSLLDFLLQCNDMLMQSNLHLIQYTFSFFVCDFCHTCCLASYQQLACHGTLHDHTSNLAQFVVSRTGTA